LIKDYVKKIAGDGRPAKFTRVGEIMTDEVVPSTMHVFSLSAGQHWMQKFYLTVFIFEGS